LIEAMNEVSDLDEQWACLHMNKRSGSFVPPATVSILGDTWEIILYVMLADDLREDGSFTMIPFVIDEHSRKILISARYNLSFAAADLIKAVVNLQQRNMVKAVTASISEALTSHQKDRGGSSRSNVTHMLAGRESEQTKAAKSAAA